MDSSRAMGVASDFACLSVLVDAIAGFSLWLDVPTFDAMTPVGLCVAKGPAPLNLFNVGATVAACLSAAMALHFLTLLIAMITSDLSVSGEAIRDSVRVVLLKVALRLIFLGVPVRLLLS